MHHSILRNLWISGFPAQTTLECFEGTQQIWRFLVTICYVKATIKCLGATPHRERVVSKTMEFGPPFKNQSIPGKALMLPSHRGYFFALKSHSNCSTGTGLPR